MVRKRQMAKILIIEPDNLLLKQYSTVLSEVGHEVRGVGNAQAAILAADKSSPDLVILEPLLATHSGMEFLYEFRSYAEWQNTPIIILSRITPEELGLNAAIRQNLHIHMVLYKTETSLKKLVSSVQETLE